MVSPREVTFHSITRAPVAAANGRVLPILIVGDGEVLTLAVEWLLTPGMTSKASKTLNDAVKAIGLLYDYHHAAYAGITRQGGDLDRFLVLFAQALSLGTINENGECAFGLYWRPKSDRCVRLTSYVEQFCRFCVSNAIMTTKLQSGLLMSIRRSWAWTGVAPHSGILSHLRNSRGRSPISNSRATFRSASGNEGRSTPFPEEYIIALLTDGCRRHRRLADSTLPEYLRIYNVRNQLAFLLLLIGGLRTEELFHVFSNDVYRGADGRARVNLYHPVLGAIKWTRPGSGSSVTTQRHQFLRERYGLSPRNRYDDKHPLWAGWKNLLLTHGAPQYYAKVFWIYPRFGSLFWHLHSLYIQYIRGRCGTHHPYYFVALGNSTMGDPWTVSSFQEAWQVAVTKIGLGQSKLLGTNPHGARHWYGQTAADMGIDPRIRQVMMHHRNIVSQLRYQQPTTQQVNAHIEKAQERMIRSAGNNSGKEDPGQGRYDDAQLESLLVKTEGSLPPAPLDEFSSVFDIDPAGIISSWNLFSWSSVRGAKVR